MPLVEEAIYERLTTFAGLTALIGTRTYDAQTVPQAPTLPLVAYRRVSTQRPRAMGVATGLIGARFQVDALGTDYSAIKAVATQVRLALDYWRGTAAGVEVQDSAIVDERDLPFESDTLTRGVSLDALVWARE